MKIRPYHIIIALLVLNFITICLGFATVHEKLDTLWYINLA